MTASTIAGSDLRPSNAKWHASMPMRSPRSTSAETIARRIAASIRSSGRRRPAGHGRIACRQPDRRMRLSPLGIAAVSLPISEQLYSPLDLADVPTLITSQSGESAEVHRLLVSLADGKQMLRLTFWKVDRRSAKRFHRWWDMAVASMPLPPHAAC